jgi:hypothetical protein
MMRFVAERRQAEGRLAGAEKTAGMRLERHRHQGRAGFLRDGPAGGEHGLVAEVDAVEIAQHGDPALERVRHIRVVAKNLHGPSFRARRV